MSAPTKVRMNWEGEKKMKAKLKAIAADSGLRKEARGALLDVGEVMVAEMKAACPVKSGKLQGSIRRRALVSTKKENMRITFLAGGPDIPYATRVHWQHKSKARFMTNVMNAHQPKLAGELAAKIDMARAAKGGGAP